MTMTDEITLLIADDHPMVRAGLRSMLAATEIRILAEAETGRQAIELAKSLEPQLVLLDIRMPDINGIEALQAIKSARPATHVLMVTTHKNVSYLLRAMAAGADGYILKDVSREALLNTIRAIIAGKSFVDQKFLEDVLRDLSTPEREASRSRREDIEALTPREMDVLQLLVEGLTNNAIAEVLGLSSGTVKGYVQTILEKLYVSDRTQAAVKAVRSGLVK
jgi:NarL family two-component system response regulator LiaR